MPRQKEPEKNQAQQPIIVNVIQPKPERRWSRVGAFVLSIIPGLGHLYKGQLLYAVVWFLLVSFCWFLVIPGFFAHLICAVAAASGE